MQHIVQIAFDFDDKKITGSIEKNVEDTVIKNIEDEIKNNYFAHKWGNDAPMDALVKDAVKEITEKHTEEIIKSASKMLCDKLFRTKAVKEAALESVLNAREDDFTNG